MKSFFKTFAACLLAFVAIGVFYSIIVFSIVGASIGLLSGSSVSSVSGNSLLKITLEEGVVDNPTASSFVAIISGGEFKQPLSLLEVLDAIEYAKEDSSISGIYIDVAPGASVGLATLSEIREAILDFKTSGKPVIAYSDSYTQGGYYLSSVSDQLFLNPVGMVNWRGLSSNTIFFKGLLDKLDIKPEIVRHGKYKSAVEPYTQTVMSEESRLQTEALIGSIWQSVVANVSSDRGVAPELMQTYASDLIGVSPLKSMEVNMVDSIYYKDQVIDYLENTLGKNYVILPLSDYISARSLELNPSSKNIVEIIYAEGSIMDGKSSNGIVGSTTLSAKIRAARLNTSVKAVVLRVNSPGGSVVAADVILREVALLQKEKPVVVSMGDMAASGGYYISAAADVICAMPETITGSIGVFGLMFDAKEALQSNLGITSEVVKTNRGADIGNVMQGLSPFEREVMQRSVDTSYDVFVNHVALGRNLSFGAVDSIAQGRVWSGLDAQKIGLVDVEAGLKQSILIAADKAGVLDNFRVKSSLAEQNPLQILMSLLNSSVSVEAPLIEPLMKSYKQFNDMLSAPGVYAVMPYSIINN